MKVLIFLFFLGFGFLVCFFCLLWFCFFLFFYFFVKPYILCVVGLITLNISKSLFAEQKINNSYQPSPTTHQSLSA